MARQSTGAREKLLVAAAELCAESGGHALTLDAVAQRARVSKGGLLYHFPNKDALMLALLDHLAADHYGAVKAYKAKHPKSSLTDSYVSSTLADKPETDPMFAGFYAAMFDSKRVLAQWEHWYHDHFGELAKESDDFALDAIVTLATDALAISEAHGINPFTPRQRARVLARLHQLAARRRQESAA
jgi:AcrR family transcriptional regulator